MKVMSRSYKGHKFIIVGIDEVTNFIVTIPIHQSRSKEIGDTLIEHAVSKFLNVCAHVVAINFCHCFNINFSRFQGLQRFLHYEVKIS